VAAQKKTPASAQKRSKNPCGNWTRKTEIIGLGTASNTKTRTSPRSAEGADDKKDIAPEEKKGTKNRETTKGTAAARRGGDNSKAGLPSRISGYNT